MSIRTTLLKGRLLFKRLITWIFFNSSVSRFLAASLRRYAPSVRARLQPILATLHSMGDLHSLGGFTIVVPEVVPAGTRPRLLIDVSTTFHMKQLSGIQRTVRELTSALLRNGESYSHEPVAVRASRRWMEASFGFCAGLSQLSCRGVAFFARCLARRCGGKCVFIVVSTHHASISGSPTTHADCLAEIVSQGGAILYQHAVEESFSGDGLIIATFYLEDRNIILPNMSRNKAETALFGTVLYA
jgi:hypothetical protein